MLHHVGRSEQALAELVRVQAGRLLRGWDMLYTPGFDWLERRAAAETSGWFEDKISAGSSTTWMGEDPERRRTAVDRTFEEVTSAGALAR